METGIVHHFSHHQNCIKSTNKIPPYARDYKKEYLFIIGIDKELKLFYKQFDKLNHGLFQNHKVDRIKYFINRFCEGLLELEIKDN